MTGDIEDPEGLICHLKELVDSYEDLVQDMTRALSKTKEELLEQSSVTGQAVKSGCDQCEKSAKVIRNLQAQLENLNKAKKLVTTLWHSSAEQIETLELRLKAVSSSSVKAADVSKSPSSDDQIKLFHAYISRLESRLEQASSEKNFYRRKLMESKLEHQAELKNMTIEKAKEIELVKATYSKEIDHLKGILEKERQLYQSSIDQRLEDARKFWANEEKQRRDTLKKNWLAQIEPIILEQERLLMREAQLSEKLYQTQQELIQTKQLLWDAPVMAALRTPRTTAQETLPPKKATVAAAEKDEKNDMARSNHHSHRSCDHEECVKYSMYLKVLQENERLGEEISSLRRAKLTMETDNQKNIQRLEQRIRELESLNHKLQEKLLALTSNVAEQEPRAATIMPPMMQCSGGDQAKCSRSPKHFYKRHDDRSLRDDPVLHLVDEFSQLCNLPLDKNSVTDGCSSSSKKKRAEHDARVEHLEKYALELQIRNQFDRRRHLALKKSTTDDFST